MPGPSEWDRYADPPADAIERLIAANTLFPCDREGPYAPAAYHAAAAGPACGFHSAASHADWAAAQQRTLSQCGRWGQVDIRHVDADWAMGCGVVAGRFFAFDEAKGLLLRERAAAQRAYAQALDEAVALEPSVFEELTTDAKYATFGVSQMRQPRDSLEAVYAGSLRALPQLWQVTKAVAEAGNAGHVQDRAWGVKGVRRALSKMAHDYDGHADCVTDVARARVVFYTLGSLRRGLDRLLEPGGPYRVAVLKNRFRGPVDGYADFLANIVAANGFLVELQLHLRALYAVKGEAGHAAYRWCRRLDLGEDIYVGQRSRQGRRHGTGRLMCADGARYEGEWKDNARSGRGTQWEPDGARYEGQWRDGRRHGQGALWAADGSRYEGMWRRGLREGQGVLWGADGARCYEGLWKGDRECGRGAPGNGPGGGEGLRRGAEGAREDGGRDGDGRDGGDGVRRGGYRNEDEAGASTSIAGMWGACREWGEGWVQTCQWRLPGHT